MEKIGGLSTRQISNLPERDWQVFYGRNKDLIWKRDNFDFTQRIRMLEDIREVIDSGFNAFFANGILLGAHRDNDFIAWDDDIDFDVLSQDFYKDCKRVKEKFIQMGYIVYLNTEPGKAKLNIYMGLEKVSFDVLFPLDEEYYFRNNWKWPRRLYNDEHTITFKGMSFKCTAPVEDYLIHVYGKDWQTPKNYKNKVMTLGSEIFIR